MLDIVEFEKVFYLYSLKEPKYLKSIKPDFFDNQELGLMFEVSKAFQERFKESPSKEQLKLLTKQDPLLTCAITGREPPRLVSVLVCEQHQPAVSFSRIAKYCAVNRPEKGIRV